MTPRQLRRAAERNQRKEQRKAAAHFAPPLDRPAQPSPSPERSDGAVPALDLTANDLAANPEASAASISHAQLAANRANAQLSRGPTTPKGKARSSLNAVKTGLTGRTVLLPTDDAGAYQQHVQQFEQEYRPVGLRESTLVQSIADTFWRLDRIRSLEMAIFAQGRTEFAANFDHEDPASRPALIDLHTFLTYEKQIRNLQIQEARLFRRYEKASAELRQLQNERKTREIDALEAAARFYTAAKRENRSFDPVENGFDFSIADIERYLAGPLTVRTTHTAQKANSGGSHFAASAA